MTLNSADTFEWAKSSKSLRNTRSKLRRNILPQFTTKQTLDFADLTLMEFGFNRQNFQSMCHM